MQYAIDHRLVQSAWRGIPCIDRRYNGVQAPKITKPI